MSRTAVLGFACLVAGLAGCAGPAKIVSFDAGANKVIVAVPDDTNSWPNYYRDEARKKAAEKIPDLDPEPVASKRVKVGEQTTTIQDVTRRDLAGADKKPGEEVTSTSATSTSDQYEYHLEFKARTPDRFPGLGGRTVDPPPTPTGPPLTQGGGGPVLPAGGIPRTPTPTEDARPFPGIQGPGGSPHSLPPTRLSVPGNQ